MGDIILNIEELIRKVGDLLKGGTKSRSLDDDPQLGPVAGYLNQYRAGLKDGRIEFTELKKVVDQETALGEGEGKNPIEKMGAAFLKEYMTKVESNIERVVMVVPESSILEAKGSNSVLIWSEPLHTRKVSENYSICPDSPYANQLSAFSFGTGFFIKKNVIATAAHVVMGNGMDIDKIRFVYGYRVKNEGDFSRYIIVPKSNVFRPSRVAGKLPANQFEYFVDGSDWALMEVTNAYEGFNTPDISPVVRTTDRKVKPGDQMYSIGHGLGLPLKVSFDGKVKDNKNHTTYFETSLTLVGGNSGSPVFFADTHELAGIYVRGIKKLVLDQSGKCLVVRNEDQPIEGQECQELRPVYHALSKHF